MSIKVIVEKRGRKRHKKKAAKKKKKDGHLHMLLVLLFNVAVVKSGKVSKKILRMNS